MVFSLFNRKDKIDPRKPRGPMPRVPDSTQRGPITEGRVTDQRELARQTAEKIDRIESELLRGLPPAPANRSPAAAPAVAPAPMASGQGLNGVIPPTSPRAPSDAPAVHAHAAVEELGDFPKAGGILVGGSSLAPEIEEAAILYANGQAPAAIGTLQRMVAAGGASASTRQAFLMLLDLYHVANQRDAFDQCSVAFAARFERSPPMWREDAARDAEAPPHAPNAVAIPVGPRLDETFGSRVESIQRAAAARRPVTLDLNGVTSLAPQGATLLVRVIDAFRRAKCELVLAGAPKLFEVARAAVETGRRDTPDSCWMLALEMLRVQGLKSQFDDLSIDFCVTYEVSPPPWEPMPEWVRTDAASGVAGPTDTPEAGKTDGPFALRGKITGRMQKEAEALRAYAQSRREVLIDCRELLRLDFVAAGDLLNEVATLRGAGKSVLIIEPSHLVSALMTVMGIHEVAEIRKRPV